MSRIYRSSYMIVTSKIFKTIQDNDLFVLPLFSVGDNGHCNCGNSDCTSPGKHPFFKYNWKVIASNKKEKIDKWCSQHPNLNWAILTGRKSSVTNKYLVVVDVDTNNHEILNKMPKTFGYTTGNGFHFWFWSDIPIKSSVSLVANKVDIRATNGYVVIPPSKHASGRKYKFINGNQCDILDLPSEFKFDQKEIVLKEKKEKLKLKFKTSKLTENKTLGFYVLDSLPIPSVRKIIEGDYKIPEGTRNKTLFRLLCSDRAKGSLEEELKLKAEEYKDKCEKAETISDKEISTLIQSVSKYPAYRNLSQTNPENINVEFFSNYIPSKTSWVSLKVVAEEYQKTYNESLDLYAAANILKKLGYTKRRIAKGNVWGIIKNKSSESVN